MSQQQKPTKTGAQLFLIGMPTVCWQILLRN